MEIKLTRKLVVNVVGTVIALALLTTLYITYLSPYVKEWQEARAEVRKREKRLNELRKAFGNRRDPRDELGVLEQEIANLAEANEAVEKVKTPGAETSDLPQDLEDPDAEIRRELYRDYMKQVMETAEDTIKEKLKNAKISPPAIKLYSELENADEAAYYMNRGRGLQGIVNAMAKTHSAGGTLIFDHLSIEDYSKGKTRRDGAVNELSYLLKMTMDTQSLVSFLYYLNDEENYYFVENMILEPRGVTRGVGAQQLNVEARINTTMVFESQVKAQVKAIAKAAARGSGRPGADAGGGWMARLAVGMQETVKKEIEEEKQRKWYQFWKWFKK